MILTKNNYPDVNLSEISGVTEAFVALSGNKIVLHLMCKRHDEEKVFNSLPKWIHNDMNVVRSIQQVFLEAKE